MENIADADYAHTKKVCNNFEGKSLGEYHDVCIQIYTLLHYFYKIYLRTS